MDYLQIIVTMTIHNGKIEAFKQVAADCMAATKAKDQNTLQYDWFLNEDETVCTVIERYKDSDALLAHIGNLGDLLGKLLAITDFKPAVYGSPSQTLLQATAALQPKLNAFYQGL